MCFKNSLLRYNLHIIKIHPFWIYNSVTFTKYTEKFFITPKILVSQLQAVTNLLSICRSAFSVYFLWVLPYNFWSFPCGCFHLIYMLLRFTHVACISSLWLFIPRLYSIICKYILFIHLPIGGQFCCFYFLAIIKYAAMNIHKEVFWGTYFLFLLWRY